MKKIFGAAIIMAVCISGTARAECPADLKGKDVSLSGTVAKQLRNPHFLNFPGEWSLGVNVPDGPCAGHVAIRTDEKPNCYAGEKVSFSGKVTARSFFGNRTVIEGDHSVFCGSDKPVSLKKP